MTDEDRIAVYRADSQQQASRRVLAETSLSGLGICLLTLQEEGEFPPGTRVGVFDRKNRAWLVNPWAGTSPWIPLAPDG